MVKPDRKSGRNNHKTLKTIVGIFAALFISIALTIVCLVFFPPTFKYTLNALLEHLPRHKFIDYKIQSSRELAEEWFDDALPTSGDQHVIHRLRQKFPENRNKDTFFADMIVVHDYPEHCQFTVFGKHFTMDITWTIQGIRHKRGKERKGNTTDSECPPPHRPDM